MKQLAAFFMGAVVSVAFACSVSGCSAFEAAFPVVSDIVKIVADDLAAGDTEGQLASDVCKALGGSVLTDQVCADVATVIADAIGLIMKDPKVSSAVKARAMVVSAHITAGSFGK